MKIKIKKTGRILSILLTAVMVITSTPQAVLPVSAAEPAEVTDTELPIMAETETDLPADIAESDVNEPQETDSGIVSEESDSGDTADEITLSPDKETMEETPTVFYVSFELSGHGDPIGSKEVTAGSRLEYTADLEPVAEGFSFDGWYKDQEYTTEWNFEVDTVSADITLYAKWEELTYTVIFDFSGKGENITRTDIKSGSLLTQTDDLTPTAAGFLFLGWYRDEELTRAWDFATDTVESDLVLYAGWETETAIAAEEETAQCVVTFYLSGHGDDFTDTVDKGSKLSRPADPEETGWLFLNWYTDEEYKEIWNFDKDTVESDLSLYARWVEKTALTVSAIAPQPFTGKAVKPAVSVYYSAYNDSGEETRTLLKAGKDYKVSYINNINTSAYVQKQEQGNWQEGDTLTGGSSTTGLKTAGGFNPQLPHVIIEGMGNYDGKLYMNFEITQISIGDGGSSAAADIALTCSDQFSQGTPGKDQKTITSLKYNKNSLKEGTDYTASIEGAEAVGSVISKNDPIFTDGGECTLTITGCGNYTGTIVKRIIVRENASLLKNAKITLGSKCKSKPLSEEGVTLVPAWQETVLEEKTNQDGDIIYDSNDEPVMVQKTYYYQYIDGDWVTSRWVYNEKLGEDVEKKLDKNDAFTVKIGDKWLKYGEDYEIEYANNTSVGIATMTITGIGDYSGFKSVNFTIKAAGGSGVKTFSAGTVKVTGWAAKMTYTGTELTQPELTLETKKQVLIDPDDPDNKEKEPEKIFEEGTDYTVVYSNNIRVGTATATFTATADSGYSGSFKKTFKITGVNMAEYVTFEGDDETLEPDITDEWVEVQTGKKDEYGDPIYTERYIHKVNTTRYMETTVPYVKSGATLNFSLTSGVSGETLVPNRDYTVSYSNNKSITPLKRVKIYEEEEDDNGRIRKVWTGEYEEQVNQSKMGTLVITGKGNYSGRLTIKYQIVQGTMNTDSAVVEVARLAYSPNTREYKPKVKVWTENAGYLSSDEFTVTYSNNKKDAVAAYRAGNGPAPTVTVTFKGNNNYENLCDIKEEDHVDKYSERMISLAPVEMQFYDNALTAKNLYIIIDNENPKQLVYTGRQVTNVEVRVYYGDAAAVSLAKKDRVTGNGLLTAEDGRYRLTRLSAATVDEEGTYGEGDYYVTYGKNDSVGKNKGSITINGLGDYGGNVSQKFTIYKAPVYYSVETSEAEQTS